MSIRQDWSGRCSSPNRAQPSRCPTGRGKSSGIACARVCFCSHRWVSAAAPSSSTRRWSSAKKPCARASAWWRRSYAPADTSYPTSAGGGVATIGQVTGLAGPRILSGAIDLEDSHPHSQRMRSGFHRAWRPCLEAGAAQDRPGMDSGPSGHRLPVGCPTSSGGGVAMIGSGGVRPGGPAVRRSRRCCRG